MEILRRSLRALEHPSGVNVSRCLGSYNRSIFNIKEAGKRGGFLCVLGLKNRNRKNSPKMEILRLSWSWVSPDLFVLVLPIPLSGIARFIFPGRSVSGGWDL